MRNSKIAKQSYHLNIAKHVLKSVKLKRGDKSWRKVKKKYKKDRKRIYKGITFIFAVAIATVILHFALHLFTLYLLLLLFALH